MKNKRTIKAFASQALSAMLFCLPAGAFLANGNNAAAVYAQDVYVAESREESSAGNMAESQTITEPESTAEPECICEETYIQYGINRECEVCKADYARCEYVNPNVKITINTPAGWHNSSAKAHISVKDTAESGNFQIQSVEAKIAQNGSWTDVTDDMYIEISENCTIYVLVTDQKGHTYEKNRYIKCFDFTKPTLNAAVSDGLLSIQAHDTDSGIQTVYVNGYEFEDITNGVLNVRLQQFDAGYQYFTIQAMDNAGNLSEVYKTENPYYTDPETEDGNESNPAEQLPASAQATAPASATGTVTEHTKTDSDGNMVSELSPKEQKKAAFKEAAESETEEGGEAGTSEKGKEFYTIQTASEKIFYLIIDREGEEETVYFLTEISENDLLNVTADNSETLPKNSAALESAIPVSESALSNNNAALEEPKDTEPEESIEEAEEPAGETEEPETELEVEKESPLATYVILGIAAAAVIGGGYYLKVVRKKKEDFLDEDDEDEDEMEEECEDDEDESTDSDADFFENDEDIDQE
ncbi:CD1107 family mobile element protein [Enterocloster clostridioformis]|uniref:Mobile element protein CD1107-like domain-containing protein n=1 Tax=Enterocloster clostridioformis TaxID=1531 RepID=A0A1I0K227_9FIRM|nr:DUF4366 domain-containing protein [Enterocloster clostridioformis]SEU16812.1 protein of unknown function [Enterocloster clostridioformis]SEW48240.1 protein of unknown function [Enterocloster clostridioformis]